MFPRIPSFHLVVSALLFLASLGNLRAASVVYGSGDFLLNDGPVYSNTGNYISSGSLTISAGGNTYTGSTNYPLPTYVPGPHTVSVSGVHGSVSKLPDQDIYANGAAVTITATPDEGYVFERWTEVVDSNGGTISLPTSTTTVYASYDRHLVAQFALPSRILAIDSNALTWSPQPVGDSAAAAFKITNTGNSPLTISQIAFPEGFSGDGTGVIAPGGSKTVTVTFHPLQTGTFSGNIIITSDATAGTDTVFVTANAAIAWTLSGQSSFYTTSNTVIYAPQSANTNLHSTPPISLGQTQLTVPEIRTYWDGSVVNLQALPVTGYIFENWTEANQIVGSAPLLIVNMSQSHTLLAHYSEATRGLDIGGHLSFGSIRVHSLRRQTIILQNSGNSPVTVSGLRIVAQKGDRKPAFSGHWSGIIPAHGSRHVSITFKPTSRRIYRSYIAANSDATFLSSGNQLSGSGK